MAIFVALWSYLLTTKLSCLQKNNFRHGKLSTIAEKILLPEVVRMKPVAKQSSLPIFHPYCILARKSIGKP